MKLFGSSGIRNLTSKELIQLGFKVGVAVGNIYRNTVIACDTRTSSDAMKYSITSGLLAAGASCCDAGIVPTPTLALATKRYDAGVMITASHNPPQYNGIKLVNSDGSAFNLKQQRQIEKLVLSNSCDIAPWYEFKNRSIYKNAVEKHIERILQNFSTPLKLRIVLDCGCGAGSMITPYLFESLDCDVMGINCYPSGFFPHDIEPTEINLKELIRATKEFGADLGIAHDGDADRMMVVDDKGVFIPGDKLLVILAEATGAKEIVTTMDASMLIDDLGYNTDRTKVGDSHVSERLRMWGNFGGEPSGSWIFPDISFCPDGVYAAAVVASIAKRNKLSLLVDEIPTYPLIRGAIDSDGIVKAELERQLMNMKPLSVNHIDGIKLIFKDGWLLVRPSGTEPKIRITAEARTEERVNLLYENSMNAIRKCMNRGSRK